MHFAFLKKGPGAQQHADKFVTILGLIRVFQYRRLPGIAGCAVPDSNNRIFTLLFGNKLHRGRGINPCFVSPICGQDNEQ
jgi:hypothetical protein